MIGATPAARATGLGPMPASRIYVIGGMALVLAGLAFGDIVAVFVLHQNASRIGDELLAATRFVQAGDPPGVLERFSAIGALLENRGTKVDAHVHVIDFGYLALLLALVQPYVALSERTRVRLARIFLAGATVLPVSVFLIHYIGRASSPLKAIGWASIFADAGGLVVIVACAGELAGFWRYARGRTSDETRARPWARCWASRVLLSGGTMLVLLGFFHGAYYAGMLGAEHATRETGLLHAMTEHAAAGQLAAAQGDVSAYSALQGERAVHIAAHAHIIELGLLAMLVGCVQPYVFLSERWKRRWAFALLAGSLALPVFVLLELRWGLLAGGLADLGGLVVAVALLGMLTGILRHAGAVDAGARELMSGSRRLLIAGGMALAIGGMAYGLWYAVFDEHQTLGRMSASLAAGFARAAERNLPEARRAIDAYASARYEYVREVDVHSHWIGLAMLLIVLGVLFERVGFDERQRLALAGALLAGSILFPLGVILQTFSRAGWPRALAASGAALVIVALAIVAVGFSRGGADSSPKTGR